MRQKIIRVINLQVNIKKNKNINAIIWLLNKGKLQINNCIYKNLLNVTTNI